MPFPNEEPKICREQIPLKMNSRIATLVMLAMFIFAVASPSISGLENMAMAQNSNQANQVDQGAQKQGAIIQNAPSNPLIFGIDMVLRQVLALILLDKYRETFLLHSY